AEAGRQGPRGPGRARLLAPCLVLLATACLGPKSFNGEAVVYVVAPLSGDQADGGQSVLGGARKRADEANRAGGVLGGKKLVVKGLDDQADEATAAAMAQKVADAKRGGENVIAVIGHYNSGPTAEALKVYKDVDIVVITPSASNPDLTNQGYTRFFRVVATDATQGPVDARFLLDKGMKKTAVLKTDTAYGLGLAAQFIQALGAAKPA